MSVDERTPHAIHGRFEELLGPELAGAFMSYLPPVGWADVATKRDLDALEARFDAAIHREVGGLRTEMTDRIDRAIRLNVFTNIATMVTLTGLVLAVTQLG